jgi:hypothetical protein|tara:strand:- start:216 stop:1841 length:1626 start_codon:yes stop_codon:yes gene_type:complete
MADSSTPNLLGASEGFNELANQLSSIKSFLQGALEAPIETVVAELIGSLGILDGDFSALIPELSSIADISFISEIQNLIALDAGSLSSLSALANIESQFGDVLSGAGFDLGGIISDATGALSGTFDDLTGGILDQVTGIVDSATGDILGQVTGVADNLVGGLIGQVTGGVADIVDSATGDILGQVTGIADNLTGGIVGQAAGLVSQGLNAEGIADNLVGGLVGQVTSVVGEIGGITEEFVGLSDFDIVNLNIPNFAIGLDGIPTLLASAAGMPAGDPVDEDGADLITPSAQIFSSNSTLASAITAAASTVKANLPKIDVASEIGTVSEAVRKEFDKQDAIIKAKLQKDKSPSVPAVQKIKNATAVITNLPPKTSLLSSDEKITKLKNLQNRVSISNNNVTDSFTRLAALVKKRNKEEPDNILASGTEKLVNNDSKSISVRVRFDDGRVFNKNNLSFAGGGGGSIEKLGSGIQRTYSLRARGVNSIIETEINSILRGADERPGGADGIEIILQEEVEARETDTITIFDEMFVQIEKTYAVPL